MQAAIARLYNSIGYDAVPREDEERELAELANAVQVRYAEFDHTSFSPRARRGEAGGRDRRRVGVRPRIAKLVGNGANRVLAGGQMKRPAAPPTCGSTCGSHVERGRRTAAARCASTSARAAPAASAAPALREFKTTLSEPVDDEQWRTLGEGAAYRSPPTSPPRRITRPALRIEP